MPLLKSKPDPAAAEAAAQREVSRLEALLKANLTEGERLTKEHAAARAKASALRYTREAIAAEASERDKAVQRHAAAEARYESRADKQRALIVHLETELNERRKQLPEALLESYAEKIREERHNLQLIEQGVAV